MSFDPSQQGSPSDALKVLDFRRVFFATSLSNTGRWLQTAALGVLAWKISESSAYLGLVVFSQLVPLGVLSLVGGSLADTIDRRTLLVSTQTWQMLWTFVLAISVLDGEISRITLLILVFTIGLGQGLYAPVLTSVIPEIAGLRNLSAAIALNSMQTNAARIVGPALGGWLTSRFGFAEVFAINGLSYLFVITVFARTRLPKATATSRSFKERIFGGFTIALRAPQVGQPLLIMCLFAFFCLPFIGQLPAIAEVNLGIDSQSERYGWFYAFFGAGGLIGATLVGTTLRKIRPRLIVPVALCGFALSLGWLALISNINVAYVTILVLGMFYFMLPTTLATAWQSHVDSSVRGRVAALWVLAFGGTVPWANVLAGQLVEFTSLRAVLLGGAAIAVAIAALCRVSEGDVVGEELLA